MKSSILIASYLSKDIWHRWYENPGSFLSRLLVASLLGGLLCGVQLAFRYAELSLQKEIGRLGLHNVTITHHVASAGSSAGKKTSVAPLLEHLQQFGSTLHLRHLPGNAEIELAGDAIAVTADRPTLVTLAPALEKAGPSDVYVFLEGIPEGLPLWITYQGGDRSARVVSVPPKLQQLFGERPVLVFPELEHAAVEEAGYMETFLLLGDARRIPDLPLLVDAIGLVLSKEGFDRAKVISAVPWLERLRNLQTRQQRWGVWFGIFCGVLVALVYGSITILEYQQNAFLSALIRSFGISARFVLFRYLAESIILAIIAAACAVMAVWLALPVLEIWMEISHEGFRSLREELLVPHNLWTSLRWLAGGAIVAVLPVLMALRRPVGRILG